MLVASLVLPQPPTLTPRTYNRSQGSDQLGVWVTLAWAPFDKSTPATTLLGADMPLAPDRIVRNQPVRKTRPTYFQNSVGICCMLCMPQ